MLYLAWPLVGWLILGGALLLGAPAWTIWIGVGFLLAITIVSVVLASFLDFRWF